MNSPTLSQGARLAAVKLKNQSGEEIGRVIEWMMDVEQGRVIYVVAHFNESDAYYAIPWGLMKADLAVGGYMVDLQQVKQYNLVVDRNLLDSLVNDKAFLNQVFDTYQMPKYWEESQGQATGLNQSAGTNLDQSAGGQAAGDAEASEGKGYGG